MSEHIWLACCGTRESRELRRALHALDPEAFVSFYADACAFRSAFLEEEPRSVAAIVGFTDEGISDLNVAAAIATDHLARKVVLVGRNLSGSARSRAKRAGIDVVIDMSQLPSCADETTVENAAPHGKDQSDASSAQEGRGRKEAPVIVVSSGRGGVGKTSLVALAALVAASWEQKVSLVDLDLACGNLFSCFGLPHGMPLDKVVSPTSLDEPDDTVLPAPEALPQGLDASERIELWGPCARPEMAERVSPLVPSLLDKVAHTSDLVLVDTSATCTDASAQAFQCCDRLLLVHDERAGGIGSLARTSAFAVRLGVARTRIVRIANHGDRHTRFDSGVGRAEVGLETARAFRVLEGDEEDSELIKEGRSAELLSLESPFVSSLSQVLAQLLEELGCLPDSDAARRALKGANKSRRRLFARRKAL